MSPGDILLPSSGLLCPTCSRVVLEPTDELAPWGMWLCLPCQLAMEKEADNGPSAEFFRDQTDDWGTDEALYGRH